MPRKTVQNRLRRGCFSDSSVLTLPELCKRTAPQRLGKFSTGLNGRWTQSLEFLCNNEVDAAFATTDAWDSLVKGESAHLAWQCLPLCKIAEGKVYCNYMSATIIKNGEALRKRFNRCRGHIICRPGTNYSAIAEQFIKEIRGDRGAITFAGSPGDDDWNGTLLEGLVRSSKLLVVLGLPAWVRQVVTTIARDLPKESQFRENYTFFGLMQYDMFIHASKHERCDLATLRRLLRDLSAIRRGPSRLSQLVYSLKDNFSPLIAHSTVDELAALIRQLNITVEAQCLRPGATLALWETELGQ